jgi:hypothetical protein
MTFVVRAKDLVNTNRMKDLAFGYYAWTDDGYGLAEEGEEGFEKNQVKDAGSGAFVAPGLGLTAKHVAKGFEHLDSQFDALNRRKTPLDDQYKTTKVITEFATMVYQMPTYKGELVSWHADVGWGSADTDIEVLVVRPGSPAAEAAAPRLRYFPWQLLPPKVGSLVWVYGWPEQKIKIEENSDVPGRHDHEWTVELHVEPAWVEEVIYIPHLYRLANFPCFRVRTNYATGLAHGMSGGAVLYNGRLVGVFSGPDLVACLWPLALMSYPISKEENAPEVSFGDHFNNGFIDASYDWNEVQSRTRRVPCREIVAGNDAEPCEKMHAALV